MLLSDFFAVLRFCFHAAESFQLADSSGKLRSWDAERCLNYPRSALRSANAEVGSIAVVPRKNGVKRSAPHVEVLHDERQRHSTRDQDRKSTRLNSSH